MGALLMPLSKENTVYHGKVWVVLLCVLWLFGIPAARAFKLVPITMEFEPAGRGASRVFHVENDSDEQVAIQVSILTRTMSLDGKEVNTPEEDDFIVYPTQILLKPRQVQAVRVKWVGNARPEREIAYRILAEQLPINLTKSEETGAEIKLVLRYLGSIYIVPKGSKPNIVIDSLIPQAVEKGERKLAITFHNRGAAHSVLRNLKLTLRSEGKTVNLESEQLEGVSGENILAGSKRRFLLPWPPELPNGPIEASFQYRQRR